MEISQNFVAFSEYMNFIKKNKKVVSKFFGPIVVCRALQQNWVRLFAMHGLSAIELEPSIILKLKLKKELGVWLIC